MAKKQFLLAHRGYSSIAPENTRIAFESAYLFGFDGVELDVHLTNDNHLVIIHDENTQRTAFVNKEIKSTNLKSLKKENQANFFKIKVAKQEIMTLKEFLDEFLEKFRFINIEIKTDVFQYQNIEEEVMKLINNYPKAKEKILFSSFNFDTLEKLFALDNSLQLAFLWWKHSEFKKISKEKYLKICKYLNPWIDIYEKHKKEYQKLELDFCLWTLKSIKKYNKYLKDSKVFAQISNYKY